MRSEHGIGRTLACGVLALVPMVLALAGVAIDERSHLGYSTWLSACRAAGLSPASVATFTLELLPSAVIGMLAGGLVVLSTGVSRRHVGGAARTSLAAHAGCAVGMGGGLLLCMLALPMPLMLLSEALLAAGAAAWLFRRRPIRPASASVKTPTRSVTSAQ